MSAWTFMEEEFFVSNTLKEPLQIRTYRFAIWRVIIWKGIFKSFFAKNGEREVALRVKIYEQHSLTEPSKRICDIPA